LDVHAQNATLWRFTHASTPSPSPCRCGFDAAGFAKRRRPKGREHLDCAVVRDYPRKHPLLDDGAGARILACEIDEREHRQAEHRERHQHLEQGETVSAARHRF
jgi:hypothetical protein